MTGNSRKMDDMYARTFDAEELSIIEFALMECYKVLKDYNDEWHMNQAQKVKQLLLSKFEIQVDDASR